MCYNHIFLDGDEVGICASFSTNQVISVSIRDGHADADRMPIRNMRRIYRAISDICQIMRISSSMRISKYIRMAIPS